MNSSKKKKRKRERGAEIYQVKHGLTAGPLDEATNQRFAFPDAVESVGEDWEVEGVDDAMDYLRMVRLESGRRPDVVTAPALPRTMSIVVPVSGGTSLVAPSEAWQSSFLAMYTHARNGLGTTNPQPQLDIHEWRRSVTMTHPTTYRLYQVTHSEIFYLVHHLKKKLSWTLNSQGVHWLWSLLVYRMPDLLTGEEINVVRGLGRKARNLLLATEEGLPDERRADIQYLLDTVIYLTSCIYGQRDLGWTPIT